MSLNDIANLIAITAVFPLSAFIYYYATAPVPGHRFLRKYSNLWRSTEIGKILMYQKISWLGFLLFVLLGIFTEPYAAEGYIRIAVYVVLVVLFWRVLFVLRKVQKSPALGQLPTTGEQSIVDSLRKSVHPITRETPVVIDAVHSDDSESKS